MKIYFRQTRDLHIWQHQQKSVNQCTTALARKVLTNEFERMHKDLAGPKKKPNQKCVEYTKSISTHG